MNILSRLILSANPVAIGLAAIALLAYGFVIVDVLPQWQQLHAAAGGRLPEEAFGMRYDLAGFLDRLSNDQRADYIVLQLLDIPFFVVQALIVSWAMALGIKAMKWEEIGATWLLALPVIGLEADLVENLGLVLATFTHDASSHWGYVFVATQLKFITAQVAIALGAFGFLVWAGRNLYDRNREQRRLKLF